MAETHIEWTHRGDSIGVTWNPTTGCDKVSAGCDNCYALTMAKRLKAMGQAKYQNDGDPRTSGPGFGLAIHEDMLALPYKWRKPRTVFVNSMSDLFHAKVPRDFIHRVFDVMADTPQHTYQILSKRSLRLRRIAAELPWPPNVWIGTSVEDSEPETLIRVRHLSDVPAQVRFLSCEPLIGDLGQLDLTPMSWVIAGGESGGGARPMNPAWARSLLQQCEDASVPFFMKQMGSVWARDWTVGGKSVAAHGDPKGGDPQYWPADLRVRDYPQLTEVPA
jgi:protein gp37